MIIRIVLPCLKDVFRQNSVVTGIINLINLLFIVCILVIEINNNNSNNKNNKINKTPVYNSSVNHSFQVRVSYLPKLQHLVFT